MTDDQPAKAIWLHLLKEGGFHAGGEIRSSLHHVYFANFSATLLEMHRNKTLARREEEGRKRYGVTSNCRIPRGLTVGEINAAMAGEPEEA